MDSTRDADSDARSRIARNYDRRARGFGGRGDDDFPQLDRVLNGREALLDVGCGAGGSLRRFVQHHGSPARSVGLDISLGMLRRAGGDADVAHAGGRVNWILGDAESLPFTAGSFDVVICVNSLSHLKSLDRALRNLRRVLRRGGRLAVKFRGDLTLDRPVERAMRDALAEELSVDRLQPILDMYSPASAQAARQSAAAAGLDGIEISTSRRDWMADPQELIQRFPEIAGYMLEPLSEAERERVLANFRRNVLQASGSDGLADFGYSVTIFAARRR